LGENQDFVLGKTKNRRKTMKKPLILALAILPSIVLVSMACTAGEVTPKTGDFL